MNDKAQLFIALSDDLVNDKKLSAAAIVKDISKEINGGGGGSPAFATAGGTNCKI
jgi:alanyl-tRNA synthetase